MNQPALAPLRFPWARYGIAALIVFAVYAIHEYVPAHLHTGPVICLITAALAAFLIEYVRRQANRVREAMLDARAYALQLEEEIARRRQVELDLTQAREAAEHANSAKDRFLAHLSHELRTPLTPVMATLSLLGERPDIPADAKEDLSIIQRNAQLETRLIDDLLDVSRIAGGKLELRLQDVDLHSVLAEVVRMCQGAADAKNLRLSLRTEAPGHWLSGDATRLAQVFWNLINNAIKFTPEGGSVTIHTHDVSSEPDKLSVEVSDSGIGVAPEALSLIFLPFEQGGRAVTRRFGGLGLGLAISKALVEAHGGAITATSEGVGRGTTFSVQLPVSQHREAAVMDACDTDRCDAIAVACAHENGSVLLVEDHQATLQVLSKILQKLGYAVLLAEGVEEAMRLAQAHKPDLLISDIGLQDGSGLDLPRLLKTAEMTPVSIALSGYGSDADLRHSREAGFVEHLTKPINMEQLRSAIGRARADRPTRPSTPRTTPREQTTSCSH